MCAQPDVLSASELYAYYTKVEHSPTDFMGNYPDIIVVLDEGRQLEFTRQTGFLPLWRTPKTVSTFDDFFPERAKDYSLSYNYVRLIKNSPTEVVVHWRYLSKPEVIAEANRDLNPLVREGITGVVHELFTIQPDGCVIREILEARRTRYRDWIHPEARTRQTVTLLEDGIRHGAVEWANMGPHGRDIVRGSPLKEATAIPEPVQAWLFDEGLEEQEEPEEGVDLLVDSVDEAEAVLQGLMTVYKEGVSGTALAFDGYYNVARTLWGAPEVSDQLTLEVWVALDVYPYNIAPIVHQSIGFGNEGYYLGVDAYGHAMFTLNGTTVRSQNPLKLHEWVHLAAVVESGQIQLYVNGKKDSSAPRRGDIKVPDVPLEFGRNTEKSRCTDFVRDDDQNLPFLIGIEGLVDELRIYDQRLSAEEIESSYRTFKPTDRRSDLAAGILPGEVGVADSFGATYKTLQFDELWDKRWRVTDFADIVVKFDNSPCSVVFWRGTNSAANWVTDNNRWMADQSSEIFTKHGCSEHMADKQLRHSHARIIENSPARVVVHWRYPCVDVSYLCTNRRHWSDEYYTIYPDGTGVRKVVWNKGQNPPGFQDIQFLTNPGETALDVMHLQAATVADLEGNVRELTWRTPNRVPKNPLPDGCVAVFNSKSEYKVFAIYPGGSISPWGRHEQSSYTDDPFAGPWNHWPVHLVPSDGRFAVAPDRVTHFAVGASGASEHGGIMLYGFTKQPISSLLPLARMWRHPPQITRLNGAKGGFYDNGQNAFVLTECGGDAIDLLLNASNNSPVVNPCLVLKNWGSDAAAEVVVDRGRFEATRDFRQGLVRDKDGSLSKILWMETTRTTPCTIEIKKK